jgi:hypothetical protein
MVTRCGSQKEAQSHLAGNSKLDVILRNRINDVEIRRSAKVTDMAWKNCPDGKRRVRNEKNWWS